jgi:hypothetical protein
MDLILSPNVPFKLRAGAFDGFPTGCCTEAALCGTAVFCTDALGENIFEDGQEIIIITRDVEEIVDKVLYYYTHYDQLSRLARRGQVAFQRVFDLETQMRPRLRIISECLQGTSLERDRVSRGQGNPEFAYWSQVRAAAKTLAAAVPRDALLILADENQLRAKIVPHHATVPFLERGGQYWGPPADDASAIRELERLRQTGAQFFAFAWPAFWWLNYYTGFTRYLRSHFRAALENEILIVFDLRQ